MNSVMWFANYSKNNPNRTTETKVFVKLKNCKKFLIENKFHGYIIRKEMKNDFL